jgi:phosphoglycerate dehydrogenase-like enzyme
MPESDVLCLSPLSPHVVEELRRKSRTVYAPSGTYAPTSNPRVLVVRSNVTVDEKMMDLFRRLEVIVRAGSGTDNIDLAAADARRITVVRVGAVETARSVAELGLLSALVLLRRIPCTSAALARGRWEKSLHAGREIEGISAAVWGFGAVGRAVTEVLERMGANVTVAAHPSVPSTVMTAAPDDLADRTLHMIAVPLRPSTLNYFDAGRLSLIGSHADRPVLVNLARWEVLDVQHACEAVAGGALGGIAVDPVESAHVASVEPWLQRDPALNILFTPHIGATTDEAQARLGDLVVAAVETALGSSRKRNDLNCRVGEQA